MRPGMGNMQTAGYQALDRKQHRGAIGFAQVIDGRVEISRQKHEGTENPTWAISGKLDYWYNERID